MTNIIYRLQKGSPLTCAELDNNYTALLERSNHTGSQLAATISDFGNAVANLQLIMDLLSCCDSLTTQINSLFNDINGGTGSIAIQLLNLRAELLGEISRLDGRIDTIQSVVNTAIARVNSVESQLNSITNSYNSLTSNLSGVLASITNLQQATGDLPTIRTRLNAAESSINSIQSTLNTVNATISSIGSILNRLDIIEANVTSLSGTVGAINNILPTKAPLTSPLFTGAPRIDTGFIPENTANDNRIPTTSWVVARLGGVSTPAAFPAGTTMVFIQAAAPPGWQVRTDLDDRALRISSTSGGQSNGTVGMYQAFNNFNPVSSEVVPVVPASGSTGATVLNASTMPVHHHDLNGYTVRMGSLNQTTNTFIFDSVSNHYDKTFFPERPSTNLGAPHGQYYEALELQNSSYLPTDGFSLFKAGSAISYSNSSPPYQTFSLSESAVAFVARSPTISLCNNIDPPGRNTFFDAGPNIIQRTTVPDPTYGLDTKTKDAGDTAGAGHSHTLPAMTANHAHTFKLDVKYIDTIVCTKL